MPVWHTGTEGEGILTDGERTASLESMEISQGAADFIVNAVEKYGEDLKVVSLGALTNISAALHRQPALKTHITHLFFMGGGITFPKPVPTPIELGCRYLADASHNITCDVAAAREVFSSGIPMTILTNDITTKVWWDGAPVQKLLATTDPADAKLVGELLKVWLDYRTRIFGRRVTGTCPHDPLTIAEVHQARFVTYARGEMKVQHDARTCFVSDPHGPHRAGVHVAIEDFLDWFSGTLTSSNP